jgi:anti-sigma B factor antagonist
VVQYETERQGTDRLRCRAAPHQAEFPLAAEARTGVPRRIVGRLSVRPLAAHEHHHDVVVLSPHGEIDLETAPLLREVLLPVLEGEIGPVVLDLSEVAFMDSTGVHVLVEALRQLELQNRRLAIVCREGGQVHRVLAVAGLLDMLTVHCSRESAMAGGDERLRPEPRSEPPAGRGTSADPDAPSIGRAKRRAVDAS